MDIRRWLTSGVDAVEQWQATFGPFQPDASLQISDEQFATAFGAFTGRLRENYPFFHPSYAGQMLKPPHPAAIVGYLTAMLVNPNNHALDVARELHPGRGIAYSAEAHYTHSRMCGVLGMPGTAVAVDGAGRLDLGALDALLAGGGIGTVVATAG